MQSVLFKTRAVARGRHGRSSLAVHAQACASSSRPGLRLEQGVAMDAGRQMADKQQTCRYGDAQEQPAPYLKMCLQRLSCVCRDVRAAVDLCHRDGSLKQAVAKDPAKYIHEDKALVDIMEMYRAAGKKVFVATNSLWDYTHVVMNFLLTGRVGSERNEDWLDYFDVVITGWLTPNPTFTTLMAAWGRRTMHIEPTYASTSPIAL